MQMLAIRSLVRTEPNESPVIRTLRDDTLIVFLSDCQIGKLRRSRILAVLTKTDEVWKKAQSQLGRRCGPHKLEGETSPDTAARQNRRAEPRARTLKRGQIVFHNGHSTFDCTVRNISLRGAMLLFGTQIGVPNEFDLVLGTSRDRRPCTVRWRSGSALGVLFETLAGQRR
jgi:hypothetical protein